MKGPEKRLKNLKKEKERRNLGYQKWKKEREEFVEKCKAGKSPKAGEYANFIDGLTPGGMDREGRRVSFVERGKGSSAQIPRGSRRISEPTPAREG